MLHPEEQWMYNPIRPLPVLEPLTTGQYATLQIGNDSSGMLRFNLSSTHRTTFCVSLYELVDNQTVPVQADVYLMTTAQYNSYEEVYRMMHGGWWWQDWDVAGGDSNLLSDVPPEWRSFNPLGWQSYRDVHQYESTQQATFSIAMDGPEVYNSLFGGSEWQDFYWSSMHGTTPTMAMLGQPTVFWSLMSPLFRLNVRRFFRLGPCHSPSLSLWPLLSSSRSC